MNSVLGQILIALTSFCVSALLLDLIQKRIFPPDQERSVVAWFTDAVVFFSIMLCALLFMRGHPEVLLVMGCALSVFVLGVLFQFGAVRTRGLVLGVSLAAFALSGSGLRIRTIGSWTWQAYFRDPVSLTVISGAWMLLVIFSVMVANRNSRFTPWMLTWVALAFLAPSLRNDSIVGQKLCWMLLGLGLSLARGWRLPIPMAMGSAGSLVLGVLLACTSMLSVAKTTAIVALMFPFFALGIPLFSLAFGTAALSARGGASFRPAGLFLPDFLLALGLSERSVGYLLHAMTAYFCICAVGMLLVPAAPLLTKMILTGLVLVVGALLFFLLIALAFFLQPPKEAQGGEAASLFGIPVHVSTVVEALDQIENFIREGKPRLVVTPDSSAMVLAQRDPEWRHILTHADLVTPDGAGVLWAAKVFGGRVRERVSGVELVREICGLSSQKGYRLFFLGARPGIAEQAAARLREEFPQMQLAGIHHGYFRPEEEPRIVEAIRRARPDVLFVALGLPRQEKWIWRHKEVLNVPVSIGVGGSFDVFSGRLRQAPAWMQRTGLEWLHRLIQEPWRYGRTLSLLVWFTRVLAAKLQGRERAGGRGFGRDDA